MGIAARGGSVKSNLKASAVDHRSPMKCGGLPTTRKRRYPNPAAKGRTAMIVLPSQCLPSTPPATKNLSERAMLRTRPEKRGQSSLNPTPSKPRYPTLALLAVLLGV